MGRLVTIVLGMAAVVARGEDGLLADFAGVSSLAAAVQRGDLEVEEEAAALGVVVRGPTAPDQVRQPLTAEVRQRLEGFDVLAGLHADRTVIADGPAKWVGGVGLSNEHARGRDAVEVRTLVGQNEQWGRIGLEVGPRMERRLPGGITLFFDGKAEAASAAWQPIGATALPGQPADGLGLIGLTGRTGIAR